MAGVIGPRGVAACAAAAFLAFAAPATAPAASGACPTDRIDIALGGGSDRVRVAAFSVEIADTPEERAQGLMNRTDLAQDAGMLFIFEQARPVAFWMKNTPLSLDMLFFGPDGRLCGLIERAEPYTLDPRPSGCDTRAVLEIHGGLAERLGVEIGARARHAAFGDEGAAWPCSVARPPEAG